MFQTIYLTDGTHFRFHTRDRAGYRVSFDQTDREQVWGVIPRPPAGYEGSAAQWIADYSCPPGGCSTLLEPPAGWEERAVERARREGVLPGQNDE